MDKIFQHSVKIKRMVTLNLKGVKKEKKNLKEGVRSNKKKGRSQKKLK